MQLCATHGGYAGIRTGSTHVHPRSTSPRMFALHALDIRTVRLLPCTIVATCAPSNLQSLSTAP